MSFLAPYMLWGAAAAGIPIALHFFYRSRYRTVPWAAMKFLLAGIEQSSRRLRFQELLLLALRVCLLVLLALALARPSTSTMTTGRGDAVDAVLLIDTSMSMAARDGSAPPASAGSGAYLDALRRFAALDGSLTRLDRAKAAALAVLDNLPPHSTVQVVTCADRSTPLGPAAASYLDQARRLIEDVQATDLGTDLLPGVSEAAAALERGQSPNKELYLFSDMQKQGFQTQGGTLKVRLQDLRTRAGVYLVRCATRTPANVAVTAITPQGSLRSGERAPFVVLVRNKGAAAVRNLTVSLEVDGKVRERESRPLAEVRPGETTAVTLTGLLDRAGRHVVTARVRPDDLGADNRLDQVIHVRDEVNVLVVDGAPDDRDPRRAGSFHLQHALNPYPPGGPDLLPVSVVAADRASPRMLAGADLCILVNVALEAGERKGIHVLPPEFVNGLGSFVQEGHGLMIFAGDNVDPEPYNRLLDEQQRLLPAKVGMVAELPADKLLVPSRESAAGPFAVFRERPDYASIDRRKVKRTLFLEEPAAAAPDEARVLLRYGNAWPAVVSKRRAGAGEVLLFATSVHDEDWADYHLDRSFVPLVQLMLQHLLGGRPGQHNRVAGEPLQWQPPRDGEAAAYDLVRPDGTRLRLGYPESVGGRPLLTATETARAGVYHIARAEGGPGEGVPFAVAPDVRESEDLTGLTAGQLDQELGFRAVHLTAGDEANVFSGADRLRSEWTPWLLAGLLALVLAEALLALLCGRAW